LQFSSKYPKNIFLRIPILKAHNLCRKIIYNSGIFKGKFQVKKGKLYFEYVLLILNYYLCIDNNQNSTREGKGEFQVKKGKLYFEYILLSLNYYFCIDNNQNSTRDQQAICNDNRCKHNLH